MNEIETAQQRLCRLMNWKPSMSHKFEIIRRTMGGTAIALSVEKAQQIADRLEALERELCDYKLAAIGQEFLDGMEAE